MSGGETAGSRFTRRHVLGGAAAAAGAGILAGPASALARDSSGDPVFSRRLAPFSGDSPVIAPGRPFVLAGVRWSAPGSARIEMRARRRGGPWSRWALASVSGHGPDRPAGAGLASGQPARPGHTPDARAGAALAGEPMWFGPADEVQLRSSDFVTGARVQFVAAAAVASPLERAALVGRARPRAGSAALPIAEPVLAAGGGQPPVIARSAWAGRGHRPAGGPFYGAVNLAFVHHSDNPNGYSAGEVPAMVLAIYLFHRYGRGWFDIGYNFVVDAFGRIWEARAGGIDLPVIGAQAGGFNAVSTGVCMLGTFNSQLPSAAALDALERLLAWKLPLHGVPAGGRVVVRAAADAAAYGPYRNGQRVVVPRIAGHREVDSTDCPGSDLYGHLPVVRGRAAALAGVPAQCTLTASAVVVAPGTPVTLSGQLTRPGAGPLPGEPLELQTVTGLGTTTTFATVTTAPDGTFSLPLTVTRNVIARALHANAPVVVSDVVEVGVAPVVTLALQSTSPLRLTGTITPGKRSITLDVYKLSGPHRHLALSRRVAVRAGKFSARLSLGRRARGRYVVIARSAADRATLAGHSAPVHLTV
ncbi:MAG TPA: N-acetylmuramoyl-L-alanine amidase [Solirubrobacteraceae bacterium]|nr:N-acetylmuramoyl-L-alanine amidase [Solirubrobacteraceae bacterium]